MQIIRRFRQIGPFDARWVLVCNCLLVLTPSGYGQTSIASHAGASTTPSSPSTQSSPPARGIVWLDGNKVKIGYTVGKGTEVYPEIFSFDGKKRTSESVGGMVGMSEETPIPVVLGITSASNNVAHPGLGGVFSGRFSNIILDFSSLKDPMDSFLLGAESATGGVILAGIDLPIGSAKELFVSSEHVVFPDQTRVVQTGGPFLLLSFLAGKPGEPGALPAGSVLVISRNGAEVAKTNFPRAGEYNFALNRVKNSNDVISWQVLDKTGRCSHRSSLGFPVSGALPNVVKYTIEVGEHPASPVK